MDKSGEPPQTIAECLALILAIIESPRRKSITHNNPATVMFTLGRGHMLAHSSSGAASIVFAPQKPRGGVFISAEGGGGGG